MNLRNLLFCSAIAMLAVAFVACNKYNNNTPPKPKEYTFFLDSFAVMEFPAEGGEGVIEWSLREDTRSSSARLLFTTDDEWITLDRTELGKFVVAPNEGEARSGAIVITYAEQRVEVTVSQAGALSAPAEAIELAYAMRLASEDGELPLNIFPIIFFDESETVELGLVLVGAEGDEILQAGCYSVANGGVDAEMSVVTIDDEEYIFADALVDVALEGVVYSFDIAITTTTGEECSLLYCGEVLNMDLSSSGDEPLSFDPVAVKAELYETGNFFLQLYIDGSRYHELDMYDVVAPNDAHLSAGIYSYADETISSWSVFNTGNDQTCPLSDAEIILVHNDDNTTTISGYIISEEGDHIIIDWQGVVEGFEF